MAIPGEEHQWETLAFHAWPPWSHVCGSLDLHDLHEAYMFQSYFTEEDVETQGSHSY